MTPKTAFSNGRSAAARLPADAGIKPGDPIRVTVLAPGKVLIERGHEVPEYTHFIRKRSRNGGNVTNELVAKLLEDAGL
jgi:virulence-associated protein VagC